MWERFGVAGFFYRRGSPSRAKWVPTRLRAAWRCAGRGKGELAGRTAIGDATDQVTRLAVPVRRGKNRWRRTRPNRRGTTARAARRLSWRGEAVS